VRPGAVVMCLVFGQDGTQMCLAEDQRAVEDLGPVSHSLPLTAA
jgi:hypothetical protein